MLRPSCLRCSASECGLCDCFCPRWHLGSLIAFALGGTLDHCICSHVFGFGFFVLCLTSSWTWRDVKESGRQSWTWRDFKERRAGTGSNWTQKCGCSLLELGSTLHLGSCDLWGWAAGTFRVSRKHRRRPTFLGPVRPRPSPPFFKVAPGPRLTPAFFNVAPGPRRG